MRQAAVVVAFPLNSQVSVAWNLEALTDVAKTLETKQVKIMRTRVQVLLNVKAMVLIEPFTTWASGKSLCKSCLPVVTR